MHFRDYGHLLRDDPIYCEKARRVSELTKHIAEIVAAEWHDEFQSATDPGQGARRIAFQSSCSLQHGEKLNGVVEQILTRAGFRLARTAYPFMCCGAAGTYSILQRALSLSLRAAKLDTLLASRPEAIATANVGCLAHLAEASPVPVSHWIQLLDEAFLAEGV